MQLCLLICPAPNFGFARPRADTTYAPAMATSALRPYPVLMHCHLVVTTLSCLSGIQQH